MRVVLIAGTEKGAFLCTSDSGRREWQVEGPIFKGWRVTATARSPSGRYFLATASQVYGPAMHTGTDLQRWQQIEAAPAYPEKGDRKLNQIWTIRCGEKRHWAGVDSAGLFTSDDDGRSWQPVSALNEHPTRPSWFPGAGGLCAHAVLVDPTNPERVWCGISAVGVWRSEDNGRSWTARNTGIKYVSEDKEIPEIGYCVHGLAQDPDQAELLYRQDHAGMYRSRDGGDTWENNEQGLPSWFGFPIAIDPRTKTLFSFPLESDEYRMPVDGLCRVYRSRNGGESWEPTSRGLPETRYHAGVLRGAMSIDALEPAGVYIGSTSGDLFATTDGGDSWQQLPCRLPRILSVQAYVEA